LGGGAQRPGGGAEPPPWPPPGYATTYKYHALHAEDVFFSQETTKYLQHYLTDLTMINLSKSDIQKLIKNHDPSLSYAKPKKASGEHWCNY